MREVFFLGEKRKREKREWGREEGKRLNRKKKFFICVAFNYEGAWMRLYVFYYDLRVNNFSVIWINADLASEAGNL